MSSRFSVHTKQVFLLVLVINMMCIIIDVGCLSAEEFHNTTNQFSYSLQFCAKGVVLCICI